MDPLELVQIGVFVLSGVRGGVRLKIYPGIPLFWGVLPRRLDQGRVWGLADNFYKDLLVFGP